MKGIQVVKDILAKKEFSNVDHHFVHQLVESELGKDKKLKTLVQEGEAKHLRRKTRYKELISSVRAKLRRVYGMFLSGDTSEREHYLRELKKSKDPSARQTWLRAILSTHLSSKERLYQYEEIYERIFSVTGKPTRILDLGCGLNPFSYPYMGVAVSQYYASDLNEKDCEFIQAYFNTLHNKRFVGIAKPLDLTKALKDSSAIAVLPQSDVCFLFKVLDIIETKGHKLSELIIEGAPAPWVIASFPTKTISGKHMTKDRRGWLERLCHRREWPYTKFSIPNEVFYIISKTAGTAPGKDAK